MAHEARLVEVDASHLTRAEWAGILWGVLLRGSRYTLPPLLVVIVTLAVFGVAVRMIALKVGISPQAFEQYDFVFEIVGDLLSAVIGIYVFRAQPTLAAQAAVGAVSICIGQKR